MRNIAGAPVEEEDFFGREREVRAFRELLDTDDILLLGPRRIGKTSLARRLMADLRAEGWTAIEVNVASCPDEGAFIDKLADAVKTVAGSWTGALVDRATALLDRVKTVRLPGGGGFDLAARQESWEAVASDALALLAAQPGRTLVYIDELPIFLFNMMRFDPKAGEARVRRFLDWFRNDARGASRGAGGLHWLVSGSVGLDTLVQNYGMADTINSLRHKALEPFSEAEALALLDALARAHRLPFTAEDGRRLVAAIGWPQPYYLQLVFQTIRSRHRDGQPAGGLIDDAVDALVRPGEDNDFQHWEGRLKLQLSADDAALATALLTLACREQRGATATALLAETQRRYPSLAEDRQTHEFCRLRDILIRDAYWVPDDGSGARRYRFPLEPLRRWWLRRHSL